MSDPNILVVEDDPQWRSELAMMYSRVLRGQSRHKHPDNSFHPSVHTFATAQEAIEFIKRKRKPSGGVNGNSHVDILSLDLNLGRRTGGNGLDVLNAAVQHGHKFATIVVTGYADDDDLRDQLTDAVYRELQSLRTHVERLTKCECIVFSKHAVARFGDAAVQVRRIEEDLISRCNGNVLRQMHGKLRESVADLNGKCFCLHFELPSELFRPCPGDWIAAAVRMNRLQLNQLSVWTSIFTQLDEQAVQTDLLGRLLFLVKPGGYFAGLSVQNIEELGEPAPRQQWLSPRPRMPTLTAGEAFLMTQLVAQHWARHASPALSSRSFHEAITFEEERPELELTGLATATVFDWPGQTGALYNGAPLSIERYVDGRENKALKTNVSRLNTKLRAMLGGVDYYPITSDKVTYHLARPGHIFIHRVQE